MGDESQGHSDGECSLHLTAQREDIALPEPEPEAPTARETKGEQQREQQERPQAESVDAESNNNEEKMKKKKKKKKKKKAKKKTPEQIKQDELDELDALIKDVTGIDVNEAPPFRASRQQKKGRPQGVQQIWENVSRYCLEGVDAANIDFEESGFCLGWVRLDVPDDRRESQEGTGADVPHTVR